MFEQKTVKETCSELKSDTHKGLTEMEAGRRLRMDGKNELPEEGRKNPVDRKSVV